MLELKPGQFYRKRIALLAHLATVGVRRESMYDDYVALQLPQNKQQLHAQNNYNIYNI